jgi:hypothetical protein
LEPPEDVGELEAGVLQQRLPDQYRHLRVVGGLARVPAAASAHLAAVAGCWEARRERPFEAELEGCAQGVADGGTEDGAEGAVEPGVRQGDRP